MPRRTIHLSESVEAAVVEAADPGESFSATVARLIDAGAKALRTKGKQKWIGSGVGPADLGRRADDYIRHPVTNR